MKHQLKNTTNLISESGRAPSLRHVEAHRAETSHDTTTEFVSQGPHALRAQDDKERKKGSGRRASGEQGRSMVEMLGTLAIMGVLSVGAVAGYRYAITKYQANETFNELKRRVVIHSQQAMVGATLDQTEMGEYTTLGYPIDVYDTGKGSFELFLQDMDKDLCDALIKANWTLPIQTRVNDLLGGSCQDEGNTLTFQFQTTMSGCTSDDECLCGTCVNGKCESSCPTGEVCAKEFETGAYGCHPVEGLVDNTHCDYPNPNGDGTCCDANGENCCPPSKPLVDKNGKCYSCEDSTRKITVNTEEMCQKCSNRIYTSSQWNPNLCNLPCPDGQKMNMDGGCHTCDETGYWLLGWNRDNFASILKEQCLTCSNRTVAGSSVYECIPCEGQQSFKVSAKEACDRCPGRIYFGTGYGYYCAWPCAELMDRYGECRTCEESSEMFDVRGIAGSSSISFSKACNCLGIRFVGTSNPTGGSDNWAAGCWRCDSDIQSIYFGTYGTPGYRGDNDYDGPCNQCPNRKTINSQYCAKYCTDKKVWDNVGACHECSEPDDFNVKGVPAAYKCNCPGVRYLDGDTCKKCPDDTSGLTEAQKVQCTLQIVE